MNAFLKKFILYAAIADALILSALFLKLFYDPGEVSIAMASSEQTRLGLATEQLISELKESQLEPVSSGKVLRKGLSVPGRMVAFKGDNIQVFEYPDRQKAYSEASEFAKKYEHIGDSSPHNWKKDVHIHVDDTLIIFYMGKEIEIIGALEKNSGLSLEKQAES